MLGIDELPGYLTLVGTTVSMFGLYYVSIGGKKKTQITRKLWYY